MKKIIKILFLGAISYSLLYACNSKKKDTVTPTKEVTIVEFDAASTTENITLNSFKVTSKITNAGNGDITEHGHVYSSSSDTPTLSDSKKDLGANGGPFPAVFANTIGDLKPETKYFVRPFAKNEKGVVYGKTVEVLTLAEDKKFAPAIDDNTKIEEIKTDEFKITNTLANDGGSKITQYGHVYSEINPSPSVSDLKTELGGTDGPFPFSFSKTFTGLKSNTKYYIRAYAQNEKGISYGKTAEVTTAAVIVTSTPSIDDNSKIEDTQIESLRISSTISNSGNLEITQHGHVYSSTEKIPTTTSSNTQLNATKGPFPLKFTSEIKSLKEGTIYYVRPYATNAKGTAYGKVQEVNTLAIKPPVISNSNVSRAMTYNSVTLESALGGDGGAPITDYGHLIGTSVPTLASNTGKITLGKYEGSFPKNFKSTFGNLKENTIYYVRSYATNIKGTTYGESIILPTPEAEPTFTKPASIEDVPIYSLELVIKTANTSDAGTDDKAYVKLNDAMNNYYLDLPKDDREKNQTDSYYILDPSLKTIKDIKYLTIGKEGTDAWSMGNITIRVNGYQIYVNNLTSNPLTIDGNDGYSPKYTISSADLRRSSQWSYTANPLIYQSSRTISNAMLELMIASVFGNELNGSFQASKKVAWEEKASAVEVTYKGVDRVAVRVNLYERTQKSIIDFVLAVPCVSGIIQFTILNPVGSTNNPAVSTSIHTYFDYPSIQRKLAVHLNRTLNLPMCKTKVNADGSISYW